MSACLDEAKIQFKMFLTQFKREDNINKDEALKKLD